MGAINNKKMFSNLVNFKEGGMFSDLVVRCQTTSWQVHRIILSAQSDFFKAACQGNFKESISQSITLQKEKPEMVDRMITFFYSGDYSDELGPEADRAQALLTNAFVYAMGDKYGASDLKKLAITKPFPRLARGPPLLWDGFKLAVQTVWTTTPSSDKGLRSEYLKKFLCIRSDVVGHEMMKEGLLDVPEFMRDVLVADWSLSTCKPSDLTLGKVLKCWKCNTLGDWTCEGCKGSDISHEYWAEWGIDVRDGR